MLRWLRRRDGAQGLVEFCLVLPLFLILIFGIIDFGMGLRAYISVTQATREGARFGAVGNPAGTFTGGGVGDCDGTSSTTVVGRVCRTMNGLNLAGVSDVTVEYPSGKNPGSSIRVSAEYEYSYITPLSRVVSFFTAGAIGDSLTLSSSTDMRLE